MEKFDKGFLRGILQTSNLPFSQWVEWRHISKGFTHCDDCLVLDGCWFQESNKPPLPQHNRCHCITEPIAYSTVLNQADSKSDYSKYDPYLFDPENYYKHGKNKMFESWGYTVSDSAWLQKEIEDQALENYILGNYTLGKLNEKGQRITIPIQLPRKNGSAVVSFKTGWMVLPNGTIRLNTPYGGK